MTVRECVVRGSVASEHIVQFFDSDESRAECVAGFLAEGITKREPVIIVAKPKNSGSNAPHIDIGTLTRITSGSRKLSN